MAELKHTANKAKDDSKKAKEDVKAVEEDSSKVNTEAPGSDETQAKPAEEKKDAKKPFNKKLAFIIGGAVLAVGAVVAVILIIIFNSGNSLLPDSQIIKDLESDKKVTQVAVGKKTYSFKVSELKRNKDSSGEKGMAPTDYAVWVTIERKSDIYGINPVEYKVNYEQQGEKYIYKSSAPQSKELSFSAVAGADKDEALKIVKKDYKKAKYKKHENNLEKGDSKVVFDIADKEYEGTAAAVYKFSAKKGWVYKKLDEKNAKFRKGVTHKENGLYTNSNVKNIMFLGIDSNDGSGRSDCMMLISVDKNTGKVKQTSFMRDNWFTIPGYGKDKLNAAYAYGGAKLTVSTIEQTFGIKIDNYVAVDFSTFKSVINALGGIDVDITSDEAGYVNWQINKNGQTSSIGTISTKGGVTHLNGQQALWLCRDRGGGGFSGDDFVRTSRQRRVIQALVDTYKTYTPQKVLATLKALQGKVKTDLKVKDLAWFAERSGRFFKYKFTERCVPQDSEWQSGYSDGGAWIIQLNDFPKLKSDIQKNIYEDLK